MWTMWWIPSAGRAIVYKKQPTAAPIGAAVQTVEKVVFHCRGLQICTAPMPPLCKGRWAAGRRLGGAVQQKVRIRISFRRKGSSLPQQPLSQIALKAQSDSSPYTGLSSRCRMAAYGCLVQRRALGAPAPEAFSTRCGGVMTPPYILSILLLTFFPVMINWLYAILYIRRYIPHGT